MGQKLTVLVIDENAALRDSLRLLLEKLGCAVATASSAESARGEISRARYDAVFASLCLRRFGSRQMARWAQESTGGRAKFFITTGWQGDLEPDLLSQNGIDDVVRRPFSLNDLRGKVEEHFGQGEDARPEGGKREQRPDAASVT